MFVASFVVLHGRFLFESVKGDLFSGMKKKKKSPLENVIPRSFMIFADGLDSVRQRW